MYRMGSNNVKPISSKGSSESVAPPSAKVILEPVANPTSPSSTIVRAPVLTPDNQSVLPAERKSSLNAQKKIKRVFHEEESDNENLGDYRGDQHARKRSKTDGDEKLFIGHHCNEPQIRIFALKKSNGRVHIYATRKGVTDPHVERKWDDLVAKNNQVNTDNVILDKEVFSDFGDVEGLNKVKKWDLIKRYVASKTEGRSMKDSDSSMVNPSQKYSCHPPHLHVGHFKNDKEEVDRVEPVPVHAKVSYRGIFGAAVKFQVLESDAEKGGIDFGGKRTLLYEQVTFLGEYLKDTEEETRAHIKKHFTMKSEVTIPVHAKPSRGAASSIVLGSEDREIGRPIDDTFGAFKNETATFFTAVERHEVELASREVKVSSDEMSLKDGLEQHRKSVEEHDRRVKEHEDDVAKHQERVKELEKSIETHHKAVEARQKVIEENEKLNQQVKALKEDKAKLELCIKDLGKGCIKQEKQTTDIRDVQAKQTTYTASSQALTTEPPELSLKASQTFEDTFGLIPDGRENAGMFMERQEEDLMIGGKKFKKRRFLQHPSLAVTGTPDWELNMSCGRFGSTKYSMPDGSSKLVEIFSPESLVQYNGRFMIQWVYMKEHQELDYTI